MISGTGTCLFKDSILLFVESTLDDSPSYLFCKTPQIKCGCHISLPADVKRFPWLPFRILRTGTNTIEVHLRNPIKILYWGERISCARGILKCLKLGRAEEIFQNRFLAPSTIWREMEFKFFATESAAKTKRIEFIQNKPASQYLCTIG